MKLKFTGTQAIVLSMLSILLITNWSCKENTILPKNLVPPVDNINTFDSSFSLITHTLYQDSFLTGGYKSGLRLSSSNSYFTPCGSISNDPAFGSTFASMHVEVLPAVPNFTFKSAISNITIDSVILSIPYKSAYGDTNFSSILQKFKVYRSLDTFSRDSTQYEFTKDTFDINRPLSTLNVNFNSLRIDSPLIGGEKQQPQLRFKLASWFADSLKAQVDLAANGAMATFPKFLDWWRGFVIVPSSTKGNALGYFDTYRTRMTIYYRYPKTSGGEDTTSDIFSFDPSYCNRFSSIRHNYSNSQAAPFINTKSAAGDSVLFVQNEPGLVNIIQIPGITRLPNVIVNKAELIFTTSATQNFIDTLTYSPIARLQIFSTDTAGNNDKVAADYGAFNSAAYVDGKRSQIMVDGVNSIQYRFIVTYSVQKMISEKDSNFRYKIMGANNGFPAAYRTVLTGSGSKKDAFKPRLDIIYTNINKQ